MTGPIPNTSSPSPASYAFFQSLTERRKLLRHRLLRQPTGDLPAALDAFASLPPRLPSRSSTVTHALVVLGVPTDASGHPTPALKARITRAAELALADPSAVLVVSGGAVATPFVEAHALARGLALLGVDPARILLEPHATTTLDNAAFTVALLLSVLPDRAAAVEQLTVVSEPYHAPRSLRHFAAACAAAEWTPRLRLGASERVTYPETGGGAYPDARQGRGGGAPPHEAALLRCLEEKRRVAVGW